MATTSDRPLAWKAFRPRLRGWRALFMAAEWLLEWTAFGLGTLAIVDVAKAIGALSILWAALSYVASADERTVAAADQRKIKHYQAWQVIFQAEGRRAGGGRRDAVQDLARDGVSLSGANLDGAVLDSIDLPGADVSAASLRGASLRYGYLEAAALVATDLSGADLVAANLVAAHLTSADLRQAILLFADVTGATFYAADLRGAIVDDRLRRASELDYANIYGIAASEEVVRWALSAGRAVCIASDSIWATLRESENDSLAALYRDFDDCVSGALRSGRRYIVLDTVPPARPHQRVPDT